MIIAALASFLIATGRKTGVIDYLQGHAKHKLIYQLLSCNFCMGFWLSLLLSIFAFTTVIPFTPSMLVVPFVAAAFNNTILK